MTLEELKIEANKLGYSLIKKRKIPKFETCICGCNRRSLWFIEFGKKCLVCKKCGREAIGNNELDARINWNKMIKKERSGK